MIASALIFAGSVGMNAAAATAPSAATPVVGTETSKPATPSIQLADEIIRRLRRLGLNFNRARIQRPYDPDGELC